MNPQATTRLLRTITAPNRAIPQPISRKNFATRLTIAGIQNCQQLLSLVYSVAVLATLAWDITGTWQGIVQDSDQVKTLRVRGVDQPGRLDMRAN
jgi:hypothetical protein